MNTIEYAAPSPNPFMQAKNAGYAPDEHEREFASLAHILGALGALLSLGFFPTFVPPLLILIITKRRGPFLLFHLNQTVYYQAAAYAIYIGVFLLITLVVSLTYGIAVFLYVLCGIALMFNIAYPLIIGVGASKGEWREYEWFGEHILHRRTRLIGVPATQAQ